MIKVNLRHILLDRNMSMRELSRQMGLHYTTVYRLGNKETGSVNYRVLNDICEFLNVQPGDILTWEPGPEEEGGRR
jgi:putative transcriptional regulator